MNEKTKTTLRHVLTLYLVTISMLVAFTERWVVLTVMGSQLLVLVIMNLWAVIQDFKRGS